MTQNPKIVRTSEYNHRLLPGFDIVSEELSIKIIHMDKSEVSFSCLATIVNCEEEIDFFITIPAEFRSEILDQIHGIIDETLKSALNPQEIFPELIYLGHILENVTLYLYTMDKNEQGRLEKLPIKFSKEAEILYLDSGNHVEFISPIPKFIANEGRKIFRQSDVTEAEHYIRDVSEILNESPEP
jgi:hypothetical protein